VVRVNRHLTLWHLNDVRTITSWCLQVLLKRRLFRRGHEQLSSIFSWWKWSPQVMVDIACQELSISNMSHGIRRLSYIFRHGPSAKGHSFHPQPHISWIDTSARTRCREAQCDCFACFFSGAAKQHSIHSPQRQARELMWAHTRSKCLSQSIVLSRSPFSHSCDPLKGVCIPSRKQRMRTSAAIADYRSLEDQGLVLCRAGPPMLCARPRPPGHASDVASWLAMLPFLIAMLVAPGPPAAHHVI
jgi:hypothetical protein